MATLKDLLYTNAGTITTITLREFVVSNPGQSANNGGCCCAWTVPAGASYIKFEMWGGGGGGGGSCCCMQGFPGGNGAYAVKVLSGSQVVPGCVYTICAGGSSVQSNTNNGCMGYDSYVQGYNLSNFCAKGGRNGCTNCNAWQGNCYQCAQTFYECGAFGGDICIYGQCGASRITMYCWNHGQQHAPVGTATVSGPVFGPGGCNIAGVGCTQFCQPVYPGGGGFAAQVYSGVCLCGYWGAAGAVSVTWG